VKRVLLLVSMGAALAGCSHTTQTIVPSQPATIVTRDMQDRMQIIRVAGERDNAYMDQSSRQWQLASANASGS
jgi:uncharacterized lipoprotein YajG